MRAVVQDAIVETQLAASHSLSAELASMAEELLRRKSYFRICCRLQQRINITGREGGREGGREVGSEGGREGASEPLTSERGQQQGSKAR